MLTLAQTNLADDIRAGVAWHWVSGHLPHIVGGLAITSILVLYLAGTLRPNGLNNRRSVDDQPWFMWLAGALMAFISAQFASGIVQSLNLVGPLNSINGQAATGLIGTAVGSLVALMMIRLLAESKAKAGVASPPHSFLLGVGAFVLAYPIIYGTGMVCAHIHTRIQGPIDSKLGHDTLKLILDNRDDPWSWGLIAVAVIGAPVVEELTYRGLLQTAFLRLTGQGWPAVLLSASVFAGMHFLGGGMPWYAIAQVFVLGIAMGVAMERTRSLGAPIAMHIAFNGFNVLVAMYA
jgi:membrane protease YdiL (CAAX protease family)